MTTAIIEIILAILIFTLVSPCLKAQTTGGALAFGTTNMDSSSAIYAVNSPTNLFPNRREFVRYTKKDTIYFNYAKIRVDSLWKMMLSTNPSNIITLDSSGSLLRPVNKNSIMFGFNNIPGLQDSFNSRLRTASLTAGLITSSLGYTPLSAADTINFRDYSNILYQSSGSGVTSYNGRIGSVTSQSGDYNFAQIGSKPTTLSGYGITDAYPLSGNPAGYLTQQYNLNQGEGVIVSGTFPSQTVSVDTSEASSGSSAIMYVGKANMAIGGINASIAAKQNQLNGTGFVKASGTNITYDNSTYITAEVDGNISNEGALTVGAGTSTTSIINSNTSGSSGVTITAGTGIGINESGNNITLTATGTAPGTNNASAYSSGTVYTLTTTSQRVDFGSVDPVITIPSAGTYLIFTNLKIEYAGLTTVLNTCNFKLRRTNNTAADISNAATNFGVVATLLTGTGGDVDIPPIIYTTSNNNDVIELWGNRQNGISVTGSINVGEASVVAVRIY